MRKRKIKRLQLRTETLRDLAPSTHLRQAAGGTDGVGVIIGTVIEFTRKTITPLTPRTCDQSLCVTDPPTCTTCLCPTGDGHCG